MLYRIFADFVLVAHFCFVVFVIFGGLLVLWRRWVLWLHFPALIWGVFVELLLITCPLTSLENHFRALSGQAGYEGGFIEHFVSSILYWQLTPQNQMLLGLFLLIFNILIYFFIFRQTRRLART
jgi:hypothetical protein